jgi:E3 ubiquitin-protein ligase mind-bomb
VGDAPPTSAERDAVAPADALTFVTGVEKDQEKLGLLLGTLRVLAVRALTACAQCSATTGVDADAAGSSNARHTDVAPPPPQVLPRPVWVCLQCESALCAACYEKKQMAAFAAWGASGGGGGGGAKVPVTESTWRGAGARVCRGPTWSWGDQDGGEGGMGTVQALQCASWITVQWDNGGLYNYRTSEDEGGPDLFYC